MSKVATSLSDRIEKSAKVIETYESDSKELLKEVLQNLGVDDSEIGMSTLNDGFISFDEFLCAIQHLRFLRPQESTPIPTPRLKMAWDLLRGVGDRKEPVTSGEVGSSLDSLIKTIRPIQQWSNTELLDEYSKDGQMVVHDELARRSKSRYVIIFNEDGGLDTENSLNMLKKAQFQETPQIYKLRSGELKEVYRVGDFPLQVFHECPIHKDVLLLDGYCEECTTHWDLETSDEKNIFLRLLLENEKNLDFRLYRDKDLTDLKSFFPKVYLRYKILKEEGNLPSLKRRISKPKQGDPFRVIGTNKVF